MSDPLGDITGMDWPEDQRGDEYVPYAERHANSANGDGTPPPPRREPAYAPKLYTSAEFFAANFKREFLIRGVLVKGQPAVLGGAKKLLKSGIGIDAAVSLDTATPLLGYERFAVPERRNVLLINGESGESTIQETAERIARARGLTRHDLRIVWGSELPQLGSIEHMYDLQQILRERKIDVFMLDPTYLCILSGFGRNKPDAANVFDMGAVYNSFARRCLDAGATPILFSHAKKGRSNEAPDLDDLAYSGIAEYARQWLLLSRREVYQGDGIHKLWVNIGGSAGHSFLGHIDVDEGTMDDDFGGKKWEVVVTPFGEVSKRGKGERDEIKANEREADEQAVMSAIDRLIESGEFAVKKNIVIGSSLSRPRAEGALERLRQAKLVIEFQTQIEVGNKAKRLTAAYKRKPE